MYINIDRPKNENDSQVHKDINDFLFNYKSEVLAYTYVRRSLSGYSFKRRKKFAV